MVFSSQKIFKNHQILNRIETSQNRRKKTMIVYYWPMVAMKTNFLPIGHR